MINADIDFPSHSIVKLCSESFLGFLALCYNGGWMETSKVAKLSICFMINTDNDFPSHSNVASSSIYRISTTSNMNNMAILSA
jgi:hypothetical protein